MWQWKVTGVIFDLGVSTRQLKDSKRGFSFQQDGPLDMRMSDTGLTVEEFINSNGEKNIADILFNYGEEKSSRKIAKAIITYKKKKRILSTLELVGIIKSVKKSRTKRSINPATKTFQALRIYVNDEINELKEGLISAINILKKKGVLAIFSFRAIFFSS